MNIPLFVSIRAGASRLWELFSNMFCRSLAGCAGVFAALLLLAISSSPARAQVASITCSAGATNSLTIPYSNGSFLQVTVIVAPGATLSIVFSPIGSAPFGLIDFQGTTIMNAPGDLTETLPGGSSGDVTGSIAADGTFSFTCNGSTPPPGGGPTTGIPNPDPHVDAVNGDDLAFLYLLIPDLPPERNCNDLLRAVSFYRSKADEFAEKRKRASRELAENKLWLEQRNSYLAGLKKEMAEHEKTIAKIQSEANRKARSIIDKVLNRTPIAPGTYIGYGGYTRLVPDNISPARQQFLQEQIAEVGSLLREQIDEGRKIAALKKKIEKNQSDVDFYTAKEGEFLKKLDDAWSKYSECQKRVSSKLARRGNVSQKADYAANQPNGFLALSNAPGNRLSQPLGASTGTPTTVARIGDTTIWIGGSGGAFRDNQSGADRKGGGGGITMGFSRPLDKRSSFGAFASARSAQSKSTALSEKLDLTALGVGGFLRYRLDNTYSLVGGFLYERGSNKFRSGTITAKFDTDRILFNGRFEGTWQQGNLAFTPSLGISWQNVSRERYTDSDGNVVAQRNLSTGRISPQINISYTHVPDDKPSVLFVRPYAAISGNWNFDDEKNFITKTGVIILDDNQLYASVTGGVSVSLVDGTTGNLSASYSGIGGDVTSILFSGSLAMPLGALGVEGPVGSRIGLNFTSSPAGDGRGMLEVTIPLN